MTVELNHNQNVVIPKHPTTQQIEGKIGNVDKAAQKQKNHFLELPMRPKKTPEVEIYEEEIITRLTIATCNIEGVKSNLVYATRLVNSFDIICFQEHWLFEFQKNELDKFKGKDFFARYSDTYDQISAFSLPRGKGGVAIAWSQALSSKVTRISESYPEIEGTFLINIHHI